MGREKSIQSISSKDRIVLRTLFEGASTFYVTLGPGVRLDVRFLGVASVLGFLLLPPATQVCGKRMFGVMKGIDDARRVWRNTPGGLGVIVDREA